MRGDRWAFLSFRHQPKSSVGFSGSGRSLERLDPLYQDEADHLHPFVGILGFSGIGNFQEAHRVHTSAGVFSIIDLIAKAGNSG